jgi:hypothetical protein
MADRQQGGAMNTLGPVCVHRMVAWQKCHTDARFYVVFMVKPAIGRRPYLAVVDDYGSLQEVTR